MAQAQGKTSEKIRKPKKPTAKGLWKQMSAFEREAQAAGYQLVCGIDEAGRGPLAGPVVAAACLLDPEHPVFGVNDSKQLTPDKREELFGQITETAICYGIGLIEPEEIDRINILQATMQAMRLAVQNLSQRPDLLLIDAIDLKGTGIPVKPVIKGDTLSVSIAAASILAKVTRDRLMAEMDEIYPGYGFARHKGYPTPQHFAALKELGPTPIHRRSFLHDI
ncbi:MAG: ribonuclease HII [Ruminococcaceae bacterium]|nr:ribonuclease HII [Oscillospiraceae bacterium]